MQKSGDLGVVRVLERIGDPDQVERAVHPHPALRVARVHLRGRHTRQWLLWSLVLCPYMHEG